MGLAASQGKMILLVQTRINQQYKLMDLSTKQLRLVDEQDALTGEFNAKKNSPVNYNYDAPISTNFSYSDLMKSGNVFQQGTNPVFITTSTGKLVVDGTYNKAIEAALNACGGKLVNSDKCFNAFANKLISGHNNLDWYKIANKNEFDVSQEYVDSIYDLANKNKAWIIETGRAMCDELNELPVNPNDYPAGRDAYWDKWDEILDKYLYEYCNGDEDLFMLVDCTSCVAGGEWDDGVEWAVDELSSDALNNLKSGEKTQLKNMVDYYYKVFSKCVSDGYHYDEAVTDKDSLNAKISNGTYIVNGQSYAQQQSQNSSDVVLVKDDKDALKLLEDDYDREMDKLKNKEKKLSMEQSAAQTRLNAIETEIQSVQSIIDKNIERTFNYCQNA